MRALPRWSVSFADLALLLLCFFVLLQAGNRQQVAAGARAAFGDAPIRGPLLDEPAARLFEPGEARLTVAARLRILDLARGAGASPLTVHSNGRDAAASRFDAWELAAARTAALARALKVAGVPEERITILVGEGDDGQTEQRLLIR